MPATANPTLTFNFHTTAVSISSQPSLLYDVFIYSCAIAILFFAARACRSLSSTGYSLSPSNINFVPVLLGLFTQCVAGVLFGFIQVTVLVFARLTAQSGVWDWLRYSWPIESILSYTTAGVVVWLVAKRNQLGEVILTALLLLALNLILLFLPYRAWLGFKPSVHNLPILNLRWFSIFFANRFLTAAIFIGAAIGKKIRPAKRVDL